MFFYKAKLSVGMQDDIFDAFSILFLKKHRKSQ